MTTPAFVPPYPNPATAMEWLANYQAKAAYDAKYPDASTSTTTTTAVAPTTTTVAPTTTTTATTQPAMQSGLPYPNPTNFQEMLANQAYLSGGGAATVPVPAPAAPTPVSTTPAFVPPYANPTTFQEAQANAQAKVLYDQQYPAPAPAPVAPQTSGTIQKNGLTYTLVTDMTPDGKTFTTQYQTQDPYMSGYISPSDLAYSQKVAAQNTAYWTGQIQQQQTQQQAVADAQAAEQARRQAVIDDPNNYVTIQGTRYQMIDPTGALGAYMPRQDVEYTQKVLAQEQSQYDAALAAAQKLGPTNVSSNDFAVKDGIWYQSNYPNMPGYLPAYQYDQIVRDIGGTPGGSIADAQRYQAEVDANHAANDAAYQKMVADYQAGMAERAWASSPEGIAAREAAERASLSYTPISADLAHRLIYQGPGSAAQPIQLANGQWALQTSSPYYGGFSSSSGIKQLETWAAQEKAREDYLKDKYSGSEPWRLSDVLKFVGTFALMYLATSAATETLTPELVQNAGIPVNSAAEFDSIEQLLNNINSSNVLPEMATDAGFNTVADYASAIEGGFSTPTSYYNAAANGFTNAADYTNALSNGITDMANYNAAIEAGTISAPGTAVAIPPDAIAVALPDGGTGYLSTVNGQYVIQDASGIIDQASTELMNTTTVGPAYTPTAGPGAGLSNGGALGSTPGTTATTGATTAAKTLTDSQAATLMGTTTRDTLMSSMIKGAAVNAAMSAVNGQSPQNILKAAMGGAVSGAVGYGISGAMDPGLLSSVVSRAAASAAAAVVVGADPMKSAMNGAVFAMAANLLPSQLDKIDAFKDLSQTTKDYIVNSLASGIVGATSGGNITQAMLTGAITTAVSKGVDYAYDAAKGISLPSPQEMIDGVKGKVTDFFKSNNVQTDATQPETPVAPTPSAPGAPSGDISNIALGTGDTNADAIYNQLVANMQEGYSGEAIPGSAMAEVVNSDAGRAGLINTSTINGTPAYEWTPEQALDFWNQTLGELGKPPVGLDDPNFQSSYDRLIANPPPGIEGGETYPKGPVTETTPTAPAPVDVKSTGISDQAPGTIFEVDGQKEIVLDGGKTVKLSDYTAALQSGNSVTVDGQLESRLTGNNQTRLENLLNRIENMSNEEFAKQESALNKEENDILASEIALGNQGVMRPNADGTYTNTTTGTTVYKDPDTGLWRIGSTPVAPEGGGGSTSGAVAPGGTPGGTGQPASVATTSFQIGDQTYQVNTTTGLAYGADGRLDIEASRAYQQANPSATALDPASADRTPLTALLALGGGTSGGRALLGPGSTGPDTPSVPFTFVSTSGPNGPTLTPNPQIVEMYQYPEPPAPTPVTPTTPPTPVTPVSPVTPPPSTEPVPPINETTSTGEVGGGGGGGGGGAPTPAPKINMSQGGYYVDANNNVVQSSTNQIVGTVTNQGLIALDNGNFYDPSTYTEIPVNKSVVGQPGTTTPVTPVVPVPGGTATGGTTGTGTTPGTTPGGTPGTGPVVPGGTPGTGGTGTAPTPGGTGGTGTGTGAGIGTGTGTGAGTGTGGGTGAGTGTGTGAGVGPGAGTGTGGGTGSGEGTGTGAGSGGGGYTDQYVYPPVVLPPTNTGGTGTGTGYDFKFGPGIELQTGGVNPGWLSMQTPPIYQGVGPNQNQYYWGKHPVITDVNRVAQQWNAVPNLPATMGPTSSAVGGTARLNIPQFAQQFVTGHPASAYGYNQPIATSIAGNPIAPAIDPATGLPVVTQPIAPV